MERLIVALDVPTIVEALTLVEVLNPVVDIFKIGYWLLFDLDIAILTRRIAKHNKRLFLDAKLNDIPETVRHGVASAAKHGADFITVHSNFAMLEAAMAGKGSSSINVMAVTALTSQSVVDSRPAWRLGVRNAITAGSDGMIMSPYDLTDGMQVRTRAPSMLIATPGVRLPGSPADDHGRVGTPRDAITNGADYIIVGRPIIHADDPRAVAERYIEDFTES